MARPCRSVAGPGRGSRTGVQRPVPARSRRLDRLGPHRRPGRPRFRCPLTLTGRPNSVITSTSAQAHASPGPCRSDVSPESSSRAAMGGPSAEASGIRRRVPGRRTYRRRAAALARPASGPEPTCREIAGSGRAGRLDPVPAVAGADSDVIGPEPDQALAERRLGIEQCAERHLRVGTIGGGSTSDPPGGGFRRRRSRSSTSPSAKRTGSDAVAGAHSQPRASSGGGWSGRPPRPNRVVAWVAAAIMASRCHGGWTPPVSARDEGLRPTK